MESYEKDQFDTLTYLRMQIWKKSDRHSCKLNNLCFTYCGNLQNFLNFFVFKNNKNLYKLKETEQTEQIEQNDLND
ncbi:hypothetical protein BpHYR1_040728 [Brachionus plicatilis]|uniref:Uncharacterized protein n=1 Tax=Brachionus plicatilis TaxID=10195 RepID=A0A3M7Q2S6_BRAPC|nr:hypothetical protein BpHYR1_040728 [Brachionus plicatilis]